MKGLRQAWTVAQSHFAAWRGNPRIILTFALGFILSYLLTGKAIRFAQTYGTLLQLSEPFIWSFGDSDSILLSSLLLLLLFGELPDLSPLTPYYLVRLDRKTWLLGQILYVAVGTLLYLLFLLAATCALCARQAYPGNLWSETAAILGYSGAGQAVALPALVRTLELSDPWSCTGAIFLLMLCYSLLLMSLFLLLRLKGGAVLGVAGALSFSLYGFLLSPKWLASLLQLTEQELYRANVAVGWLSPLNHAAYHMHNFGYDQLPTLGDSYLLFALLILLTLWGCGRAVRTYSFDFTGGKRR